MNIADQRRMLLKTIGKGRMPPIAYDTAWVARLGELDPELSNAALSWLCENQLSDGSWGAEELFYYHDRVISTLAAMIALYQRGRRSQDRFQIDRGLAALERICAGATQGLAADLNGATVGFEMIAPTLVAEAQRLGLIADQDGRILGRLGDVRAIKAAKLRNRISRYVTVAFSAEMAGADLDMLDTKNLPEANGSIGYSPAATAYYALNVQLGNPTAMRYLKNLSTADSGGFPNVAPFDVFEVSWTLWNLALTNPNIVKDSLVEPHVEFLKRSWRPGRGTGFAAGYSAQDGDDTALVYDALHQYGVKVDLEAVLHYEQEDHFRCYALEADPSTSAHAHILSALRRSGMDVNAPSVKKVLEFLLRVKKPSGFWFDKWHLSPYYVTAQLVIACSGYAPDVAIGAVDWILKTQRSKGSWGAFLPTAEETAYCIQALWCWQQTFAGESGRKAQAAIEKAIPWLADHFEPPYPPLWVGKGLYCPENVIRSAVLSALEVG